MEPRSFRGLPRILLPYPHSPMGPFTVCGVFGLVNGRREALTSSIPKNYNIFMILHSFAWMILRLPFAPVTFLHSRLSCPTNTQCSRKFSAVGKATYRVSLLASRSLDALLRRATRPNAISDTNSYFDFPASCATIWQQTLCKNVTPTWTRQIRMQSHILQC